MDLSSLNNLENLMAESSVKLFNSWIIEFVRQNYIYIIALLAFLFLVWFIGLMIKNWLWKIDRISGSLEKIAISLDSLVQKSDKKSGDMVFTKKVIDEDLK
ncbi:hypothetical protein JXK06_00585 [Patescibacteria group bacterium]|nr:hypothetical protein [Patescibacteria group bacterium]